MTLTPEERKERQRAALARGRETARANREAQRQAAAATLEAPPVQAEEGDAIDALLKDLAAAVKSSAEKQAARQEKLEQVAAMLARLDPEEYRDLADHPAVQQFLEVLSQEKARTSGDPPGTIYNRGTLAQFKKPWTWGDVWRLYPSVTIVPTETTTVVAHGLAMTLEADREVTVPSIFADILAESRKARRVAAEHAAFLFGQSTTVSDPTVLDVQSHLVRGRADRGTYLPGGGVIAGPVAPEGEGAGSGEAA